MCATEPVDGHGEEVNTMAETAGDGNGEEHDRSDARGPRERDREGPGRGASAAPAGAGESAAGEGAAGPASEPDPTDALDGTDALEAQLSRTETELRDLRDRHLRLLAEFENFRRRTRDERESVSAEARCRLVGALVPVIRDLERAHEATRDEASSGGVQQGLALVLRGLRETLAREGITEIDPRGEPFDETCMEAVAMIPSADVAPGAVIEVLQKGYRLGDRLIEPARVLVSSGPAAPGGSAGEEGS